MTKNIKKIHQRLDSIDFLRGLVMIIMLLDHVREFVHADAFRFNPTDLSKTNVLIFLTRWVTHLCAPTFIFLAGTSIYLQLMRGKSRAELSKFLLTRGLWLILLEFTIIRLSMVFNFDYQFLGFAEVIWIFGVSMIVLAALIHLPIKVVGILGAAMIVLHHLLDSIKVPPATAFAANPPPEFWQKIWLFLHQPGIVPFFDGTTFVFVAYPLIPWIGVMAAGYWFGTIYNWENERRRRFLLTLGGALIISFFIINIVLMIILPPIPQTIQEGFVFKILAFINITKYPPSLLFLLLTLGAGILILWFKERTEHNGFLSKTIITFGRVPLFYFILQMFWAHGAGVLLGWLAGKDVSYLFANFPDSAKAPPDAGFDLWVVYAVWIVGLIVLYPLCRWYAEFKKDRRGFPFSYL